MGKLETQANLALRATKLGIDDTLIIRHKPFPMNARIIAEALEAIIGAVYVDSDSSLFVVQRTLKKLRFDEDLHQIAETMKPQLEAAAVPTASPSNPATESVITKSTTDPATDTATEATPASTSNSTPDSATSPAPNFAIKTPALDSATHSATNSATDLAAKALAAIPEEDLSVSAPSAKERFTDRPLLYPQLFERRWKFEKKLAYYEGGNPKIYFSILSNVKLQMKKHGVTPAEYEAYKRRRLGQEKGLAKYYNNLQCHMVELERLLDSKDISLQ